MNALPYLLQAGLLLAVLTLCYRLLLRRATWFELNRYLLWLNLALAIGLPLVELPDFRPEPVRKLVQRTVATWPKAERASSPASATGVVATPPDDSPTTTAAFSSDWRQLLMWVYGLGVALLAGRFLIQVGSLGRLIARSNKSWEDDIWLVNTPEVNSPFSFFRWVVLNPSLYEEDELTQILLHERVHSKQWHSIDMLTAEVMRIVFWFNPFAWWHQGLVQENLEYLVDREVLSEGIEKKAYQYYLLKASLSSQGAGSVSPELTNSFNRSQLKKRVSMMNRPQPDSGPGYYLLFGFIAAISCLAFTGRKPSSKYVVVNRFGVYGLITAVTTKQDLEAMQKTFADNGLVFHYQADINADNRIDHVSVELKKGRRIVARTFNEIPPLIISAAQPSLLTVQAGRNTALLPDTLKTLWERERPAFVLNGQLLRLAPGQPFGYGSFSSLKRGYLTAQEAVRRFGPDGRYGAATIDGTLVDAVFATDSSVVTLAQEIWKNHFLPAEQQDRLTFLIDGRPGTYGQFLQIEAPDKVTVIVADKKAAEESFKVPVANDGLVVVTTKKLLIPPR